MIISIISFHGESTFVCSALAKDKLSRKRSLCAYAESKNGNPTFSRDFVYDRGTKQKKYESQRSAGIGKGERFEMRRGGINRGGAEKGLILVKG